MFSALTIPTYRYWFMGLLVLWALFLFGGFLLGSGDPARRMPTWTRMASSITLVIAAISWVLVSRETEIRTYSLLIMAGMIGGLIGDLWLAGLLPGGRNVLGGIAAFGIGHVFYIIAFLWLGGATPRWAAVIVWLLIGALGWFLVVYQNREPDVLVWAALAYALLLATTAGLATSLALQDPRFIPLAIGAALFLLSDLILAGELFAGLDFRYIGDVVWLTYGPAQMLIVYSVGAALASRGQQILQASLS